MFSQSHFIKFMVFPGGVINQASLGYELGINDHHSVGIQASGSFYWILDPFFLVKRATTNYRYYYPVTSRVRLAAQVEIGYYELRQYNTSLKYYLRSHNISSGVLIGARKRFGTSERWSSDVFMGITYDYRIYASRFSIPPDYKSVGSLKSSNLPENRFYLLPRVVVEVCYRF